MANMIPSLLSRRLLVWIGGLLIAGALVVYVLAPWLARRILVREASAALGRPVHIESVSINPFRLSVGLSGVSIPDADHSELLGWDRLVVNLSAASLWNGTWSFDEIRLTKGRIHVAVLRDGTTNLAALLAAAKAKGQSPEAGPEKTKAPAAVRPVAISRLVLDDCSASYSDDSSGAHFATTVAPIRATFENLTTRDEDSGLCSFSASTESGERISWSGRVRLQPVASEGHVALEGIHLAKYARYIDAVAPVRVPSGLLALAFDYKAALGPKGPSVSVSAGHLDLKNLSVSNPGEASNLLEVASLVADGLHADTEGRVAGVASVVVSDPSVVLRRFADGRLDLPAPSGLSVPGAPAPKPSGPPWVVEVGALKVSGGRASFADASTPRPVSLRVAGLSVTVDGFSTRPGTRANLDLGMKVQSAGDVHANGSFGIDPVAADLSLKVSGIDLPSAGPYLAPYANVIVSGGSARFSGHLVARIGSDGRLQGSWKGDAGLAGLDLVDPVASERLVSLDDLAVNGMNVTLSPLAVSIQSVVLKDPSVNAVVLKDKRLNFSLIRPSAPSAAAAAVPQAVGPATPAPEISIGSVALNNARVSFEDRSFQPGFSMAISHLDGRIEGLSSKDLARASVDLSGNLGGSPLKVEGRINPLAKNVYSDVTIACDGIEMPLFTPYSGRYVGYTVSKGKLSLDLRYRLSSDELIAENHVLLDQFYLGDPVQSPDAVKLPIKLGLALLRDREGRINIDMPIRGNLKDPDFRYGKLVWQTVGNLIVKAAASPFSLLAGIVGRKEDLSRIDFDPGRSVLTPEARQRLTDLAKALMERPDLTLEIAPDAWSGEDDRGLREVALEGELRRMKWRDLAKEGKAHGDASSVTLTPGEFERYLTAAYLAEHPTAAAGAATHAGAPGKAPEPAARERRASERRLAIWRGLMRILHFPSRHRPAPEPAPAPSVAAAGKAGAPAAPQGPSLVEMRSALLAEQTVSALDREKLSADRENRIQAFLTTEGKIPAKRLFIVNVPPSAARQPSAAAPGVRFTLK